MDKTLRIWNHNDIAVQGKSLEEAATVVQAAVELGPVDVQVGANRVGVTSMDGSIKIFDIQNSDAGLQATLLVDSNAMDRPADSIDIDPWKFCFNPRDNSQLITG